jgi:hypothetical protein
VGREGDGRVVPEKGQHDRGVGSRGWSVEGHCGEQESRK